MFSNYSSTGESRTQRAAARKGLNKRWWADVGRATAMPNIRDSPSPPPPPLKTLVNPVTMRRARSIVTPIGHKGPPPLCSMRAYVHRAMSRDTRSCLMHKANSVPRRVAILPSEMNFRYFSRVRGAKRGRKAIERETERIVESCNDSFFLGKYLI